MNSKVFDSFAGAVADIPDGASIFISGFTEPGTPHNLLRALWEQGAKDLTIIANTANGSGQEELVNVARLVAERRVRKVILAFTAGTHPSRPNVLESLHEAGEVEAEIVAQGTLAERMRAAGAGIPAFYTPAAVGTELAEARSNACSTAAPTSWKKRSRPTTPSSAPGSATASATRGTGSPNATLGRWRWR